MRALEALEITLRELEAFGFRATDIYAIAIYGDSSAGGWGRGIDDHPLHFASTAKMLRGDASAFGWLPEAARQLSATGVALKARSDGTSPSAR